MLILFWRNSLCSFSGSLLLHNECGNKNKSMYGYMLL